MMGIDMSKRRLYFYFSIYGEIQATGVLVGPIPCIPQNQGEKLMM